MSRRNTKDQTEDKFNEKLNIFLIKFYLILFCQSYDLKPIIKRIVISNIDLVLKETTYTHFIKKKLFFNLKIIIHEVTK